jgi:hypothetical protein
MPRDAQGNPRSGFARKRRADEAHGETAKEEREEERGMKGEGAGEKEHERPKKEKKKEKPDEPKPEIDASPEDEGDIGDVVEMHGPAHEINMKSDHAAGTHEVESIHGEKRHKKTYNDPMEAMRHAHMAMGMGEPQQQQEPTPTPGGNPADTMSMLQNMGRPSGMQGF